MFIFSALSFLPERPFRKCNRWHNALRIRRTDTGRSIWADNGRSLRHGRMSVKRTKRAFAAPAPTAGLGASRPQRTQSWRQTGLGLRCTLSMAHCENSHSVANKDHLCSDQAASLRGEFLANLQPGIHWSIATQLRRQIAINVIGNVPDGHRQKREIQSIQGSATDRAAVSLYPSFVNSSPLWISAQSGRKKDAKTSHAFCEAGQ